MYARASVTTRTLALLVFAALVHGLAAQPNTVSGLDGALTSTQNLYQSGRLGVFPTGRNGITMGVDICNVGSVPIDWFAPMSPNHPFYAFLVARESNGRFEQISDRSFLKHGFAAINGNGCGVCTFPGFERLGPNCSDVYTFDLNANRYFLGPADEIDPWLGVWDPVGSYFDQGNAGPPQNMDGQRSLTQSQVNAMDPVMHRVEVDDADLDVPGASFYYQTHVVLAGEHESLREDNMVSRRVGAQWNGARWSFTSLTPPLNGSILQQWKWASVESNSNGNDDGRFYVAVVVTGPDSRGIWHYEYAIHNRDNSRGGASLRIPISAEARVLNPSFRDIDSDPLNDWTVSVTNGEIAFLAGGSNALEWNTIYNFSFDSDAAPLAGQVALDQARPGPGTPSVAVNSEVPSEVFNRYLGDGCGAPAPVLSPAGDPPIARIPNSTFGLQLEGLQPGGAATLFLSLSDDSVDFGNDCLVYIGLQSAFAAGLPAADVMGATSVDVSIPNELSFQGLELNFQAAEVFAGGPLFGQLNLSNGLKVRVVN